MLQRFLMLCQLILALALALAILIPDSQPTAAQTDWELLPNYPDSAYQLWAHQSGAVFALGQNALYRSDDTGETWQALGASKRPRRSRRSSK
jgi:hypothetical protein